MKLWTHLEGLQTKVILAHLVLLTHVAVGLLVSRMALHSSISAVKYPPSDLYHDMTALCYKLWQADWNQHTGNILLSVKPHLGYYSVSSFVIKMLLFCEDCVLVILDFLIRIFSLKKISLFVCHVLCPYCCSFTPWVSTLHYCKRKILLSFVCERIVSHS